MKILRNLVVLFFFVLFTFEVISQNTATTESGYINVPNGKLYYETTGRGEETIVFIHDGLVHHEIWDNQFTEFSKKNKVVRYDRRGYGKSPKPELK